MSIDQRAEELAAEFEVAPDDVRQDLENLVAYSVPMEEALDSLRRKYDDDGEGRQPSEASDIGSVVVDDRSVSVMGRILTVGTRSIRYRGADHVIREGTVADETGTIDFTAWESFDLEAGDSVAIDNASVREWNGEPELNLGEHTTVRPLERSLSVPYRVGGDRTLDVVEVGDRGLAVDVRILEVERRTIDGRDGETEILSGVLADETAKLPFTDWDPRPAITAGASVRLDDVYVRAFRGVPSINLSSFTAVTPLEDPVAVLEKAPRRSIRAARNDGPAFDIELRGAVVDVRDGSGLVKRCPECNRVIQRGACRSHGDVDGFDDLRLKVVLDDGTGSVTAVLGTDLTASIYGGGVEAAATAAREAMDAGVVAETLQDRVIGRQVRVRGSLSVDEYGATMNATEFEAQSDDPAIAAERFLEAFDR